ncbi:ferritin family protein [Geopsychrobacter electrodiphilus]|uniref:ferritin family protein n=1 Tax=Geopsychrobacter electrodiphilus TaxID=225196 RepID=UPI00035CD95D|nr:ferritin family protein [Geopsychrobacter electrodiphilus]
MRVTELKTAIRKMIQVELDAMVYYQKATEAMQDEGAIFHFNQLADEEREHARSFYAIYPEDDLPTFDDMVLQAQTNTTIAQSLDVGLIARLDECQALQLAMKLEKEVEGNLRKMALELNDIGARAVVEKNAESTQNHYEMIASDYARLYNKG